MKKIILIIIVIAAVYFIFIRKSGKNNKGSVANTEVVTIADLNSHRNIYADSLVELKNLIVIESSSLMNYSKARVKDRSGEVITLVTNHTLQPKQKIKEISGRLKVLYSHNNKSDEVFMASGIKPVKKLIDGIKNTFN